MSASSSFQVSAVALEHEAFVKDYMQFLELGHDHLARHRDDLRAKIVRLTRALSILIEKGYGKEVGQALQEATPESGPAAESL